MTSHRRTMQVFVNPFAALDGAGRAAGVVPRDRIADGPGYIGARVVGTDVEKLPQGDPRTPRQKTVFVFEPGAIEVPDSSYYRSMVESGELLTGTVEEVRAKRAAARTAALSEHRRVTGEDGLGTVEWDGESPDAPTTAVRGNGAVGDAAKADKESA